MAVSELWWWKSTTKTKKRKEIPHLSHCQSPFPNDKWNSSRHYITINCSTRDRSKYGTSISAMVHQGQYYIQITTNTNKMEFQQVISIYESPYSTPRCNKQPAFFFCCSWRGEKPEVVTRLRWSSRYKTWLLDYTCLSLSKLAYICHESGKFPVPCFPPFVSLRIFMRQSNLPCAESCAIRRLPEIEK